MADFEARFRARGFRFRLVLVLERRADDSAVLAGGAALACARLDISQAATESGFVSLSAGTYRSANNCRSRKRPKVEK